VWEVLKKIKDDNLSADNIVLSADIMLLLADVLMLSAAVTLSSADNIML
jgi:hypothetical protein